MRQLSNLVTVVPHVPCQGDLADASGQALWQPHKWLSLDACMPTDIVICFNDSFSVQPLLFSLLLVPQHQLLLGGEGLKT
jgi:hypothetical protein